MHVSLSISTADQSILTVQAHEPLRVSLEDLRTAGEKGKWWLVGAAWAGDPLVDHQQETSKHGGADVTDNSVSTSLQKLARKQGMNTDIRRSIFVVLMSSDVRNEHNSP